ncbi:LysR family transcriptional regulator [Paenarthrobacter ureafaciens]|uniref:LysR family transcriptional regulator n=1 Tax=Paenarthrobacter ureafaciens TaxID=37931 RepID=UPI0015BEC792|nr:LysR family transcriptional regulator [Paenarthrobacter ureafaciens]MEC3854085.1 LysR family transcriptional regulator [Paenarthrobacter ureafaciens]
MSEKPLPDVARLRLLNEVAQQGSLAGAARVLGITSSAVSQQISILEREAGAQLLDRSSRGVGLTGAGEILVEHARAVVRLLEETRAEMDQLSGELAGRVRIGSIPSIARTVLLSVAEKLEVTVPDVELTVNVVEPVDSIEQLLNGALDIAIIDLYDNVPMAFPDYLVTREVANEPLVLVTPPDYVVPARLKLADLKNEPWVLTPEAGACGQAVRYACRTEGFEPNVRWTVDDLLLLVESISRGRGISLLPPLAVDNTVAPVGVHAFDRPRIQRRVLTVTRASDAKRPIVKAVLDEIHSLLGAAAA